MKFDDKTVAVLKNFTTINTSLVFRPGNKIATISPSKTIVATADIDESIDDMFAIYDLSKFLGTLSLFENPELVVHEDYMEIKKGKRKIDYYFTEPSFVTQPPENSNFDLNTDVQFSIEETQLHELVKALSVLMLSEISVIGDGSTISLCATDEKSSDKYSIEVGETDKNFKMVFKAENLKLMPGSYEVVIDKRGISNWKGSGVEYYITVEQDLSSFED
tara:strand:- start:484 stop:1140 length:657 start_codon:yes stop_codon:yes gene_type:complete